MVHRKSTYKLNYKKFNLQECKDIWRENVFLRAKKRYEDQSHHSIEESDTECECDSLENEEPYTFKFERNPYLPSKEKPIPNICPFEEDEKKERNRSFLHEVSSLREKRGVMKCSSKGEYDLIPAVVELTPQKKCEKNLCASRKEKLSSLTDLRCKTIRPPTTKVTFSVPEKIDTKPRRKSACELASNTNHTSLWDTSSSIQFNSSSTWLKSSRKQPRIRSKDDSGSNSLCRYCGKDFTTKIDMVK